MILLVNGEPLGQERVNNGTKLSEKTPWSLFFTDSLCGLKVSAGLSLFFRLHTVKVPSVWEHMNRLPSFNQCAETTDCERRKQRKGNG